MWVRSLGWEDPPEVGMATHSSILAWRIPWAEGPGGCSLCDRRDWDSAGARTLCAAICRRPA